MPITVQSRAWNYLFQISLGNFDYENGFKINLAIKQVLDHCFKFFYSSLRLFYFFSIFKHVLLIFYFLFQQKFSFHISMHDLLYSGIQTLRV